ncbi:MAG: type II secretion system F family protein [Gammaproteobacteria bacterium]|nr:type II secretion system F family protein [Gammaproteobacteria bacterium]
MAMFAYKGRKSGRGVVSGEIQANSVNAVVQQLRKNQIIPIEIKPIKTTLLKPELLKMEFGKKKVSHLDITFFSRQLYTLLKAGVPIAQALNGLNEAASNPTFKAVIAQLCESLEAGDDFTVALAKHPKYFSNLYVNMVSVGESTGNLPQVLLQMSNYLNQEKETRDQVKAATRYPMMVMFAVVAAIVILNIFVIPAFKSMFTQMGSDLPFVTQILISFSDFMVTYWYVVIGFVISGVFAWKSFVASPQGKFFWHHWKIRIPIMGPIVYGSAMARFARGFSITSRSGLPVVQSIPLLANALDNVYLKSKFDALRQGVERGEGIAVNAKRLGIFPNMVNQMLAVGEETGQMEELLDEIADYFEGDVAYKLKGLSASIEPIMIAIIGGLVMLVMLGVFLPMWGMMDAMRA